MSEANENEQLRQQLRELEARVARLEADRVMDGVASSQLPKPAPAKPTAADVAHASSDPQPLPPTPPPIPEAAPAAAAGPTPEPAAREPREPHEPREPREPHEPREPRDLEQFFGLTILGRVGIAAVVLAAAYFGQLGWTHLGPAARTTLTYVFGAVLVAVGALLRRRVDEGYIALMWGGGVAVFYVAGVLAHLRYEVFSSPVALGALLATAALGQLLARLLKLQAMATVALAGAYIAPVAVGMPLSGPTAYFVLLLALHSWAAWIEHRWQWHVARGLAVVATLFSVMGWYSEHAVGTPWSFLLHAHAIWLLLAAPELLRAACRKDVEPFRVWAVFVIGLVGSAVSTGYQYAVAHSALVVGVLLLGAGACLVPRHRLMGQCLARIPAVLLLVGVMRWWILGEWHDEWVLVLALSAAGFLQLAVRRLTQVGELGAALVAGMILLHVGLRGAAAEGLTLAQVPLGVLLSLSLMGLARLTAGQVAGFLLAIGTCICAVLHSPPSGMHGQELVALALVAATTIATCGTWLSARHENSALGAVVTVAHAILVAAWLLYCLNVKTSDPGNALVAFWNVRFLALVVLVSLVGFARSRLPARHMEQRGVLGTVVLVASYVGGLLEVIDLSAGWTFGPQAAATSLYSLLYASLLLGIGFLKEKLALRWAALVLFGGVAVKVAAYDLSQAKTPVRVLVTGVLGGVLLVVAWGYARRKRDEQRDPGDGG